MMGCKNCKYSPSTYEEYCIAQSNPDVFCPDAYKDISYLCGNYLKEGDENDERD